MKALCVAMLVAVMAGFAGAAERGIYIPQGEGPVTVQPDSVVRLEARGIAGSQITAKIDGPGEVQMETVLQPVSGKMPLVGGYHKEFEIKAKAKGKITVTLTVTYPQPNIKPVVTTHVIDVE